MTKFLVLFMVYHLINGPVAPGAHATLQNVADSIVLFLKGQAPGAKYILSVCTGSWFLAKAGILNGKKATTNKAAFTLIMVTISTVASMML
jgi:putative intracellular protease/amidase